MCLGFCHWWITTRPQECATLVGSGKRGDERRDWQRIVPKLLQTPPKPKQESIRMQLTNKQQQLLKSNINNGAQQILPRREGGRWLNMQPRQNNRWNYRDAKGHEKKKRGEIWKNRENVKISLSESKNSCVNKKERGLVRVEPFVSVSTVVQRTKTNKAIRDPWQPFQCVA